MQQGRAPSSSSPVTRMSLCVLGSGSGGNCSVLAIHRRGRVHPDLVLIDLGLSPRQTRLRMQAVGLRFGDVVMGVITHFDHDHFNAGWLRPSARGQFPVRFHLDHWGWATRAGLVAADGGEPFDANCDPLPGVRIHTCRNPHDRDGSTAYRFQTAVGALGYATDLGRVRPDLLDIFDDLDLLAIESNYCPQLQTESDRPAFLKHRIMNGRGHLSNQEAYDAVQAVRQRSARLRHIVLLHLSRQCNSPERIRALYRGDRDLARCLTLSMQTEPTAVLSIQREPEPVQHLLFGGKTAPAASVSSDVHVRHVTGGTNVSGQAVVNSPADRRSQPEIAAGSRRPGRPSP
ncbi:MAG: MBL fold metallo-hydrolase [Planctomycetota bacterium]